jgi:hypothetical protein
MKLVKTLTLAVSLYLAASTVCHAEIANIRDLANSHPDTSELSTDQIRKLFALTHEYTMQGMNALEQAEPFSNAIIDSLGGIGPVDGAKLNQLMTQASSIYAQTALNDLTYFLQIRALLTPAQLSAIAARFHPTTRGHATDDPTSQAGSYAIFGDDLGFTREQRLSDAQMAQLATLEAAARAKLAPIWRESDANRVQLDSLLNSAGAVTFEQLAPLQQRISALRIEHDAVGLDLAVKALALLTPAQRAQAATLRTQIANLHAQERALRN